MASLSAQLGEELVSMVLAAFELEPDEQGWCFDGWRRVYTEGQPDGWEARMVQLTGGDDDPYASFVPVIIGHGSTLHEALKDMGRQRKGMP